jgi:hydrogenase expression/formation protein
MDLEGLTKHLLALNWADDAILQKLVDVYKIYKPSSQETLNQLANAILHECKTTYNISSNLSNNLIKHILEIPFADITMGQQGVGCRGQGDFFVHSLITKLSRTNVQPLISPESLDDTGAVELLQDSPNKSLIIFTKMEGMHSRLSDYPFLAGFHVTRAAIRDLLVKGAFPVSLMVDVHLADDGDVGKLFDFQAGIASVAELTGVPITAGSTLRIGGDMVIGDRLTGGIAAVGYAHRGLFRKNIRVGDAILMTEGAGGGTITTTALYGGSPEILLETLNVKFITACLSLLQSETISSQIHSMTDVTNGGLRGDLYEIMKEAEHGFKIYPDRVRKLVNAKVLNMLDAQNVDYLGVSLDALLIFCPPELVSSVQTILFEKNIQVEQIGYVIDEPNVFFITKNGEDTILPRFRESAYTKVKQVVDMQQGSVSDKEQKLIQAFNQTLEKKEKILNYIRNNQN